MVGDWTSCTGIFEYPDNFPPNVFLNDVVVYTSSASARSLIEYALFVTTNVPIYLDDLSEVVDMVGGRGFRVTIAEYSDDSTTVAECPDNSSTVAKCPDVLSEVVDMASDRRFPVTVAECPDNSSTVAKCPDVLSEVVDMASDWGFTVVIAECPVTTAVKCLNITMQ